MPHFFISYAKKDTRELALQLNEALNKLPNVTAWVDKSLRAGRSWEIQIQSEIDRCDYMIVLYSPDINRHKHGAEESYVLTEISYAKYTVRKPIIPVMAQKTEPPISLTMAHYIDFTISGLTIDDLVIALSDEAGIGTELSPSATSLSTPISVTAGAHGNESSTTKSTSPDFMPSPFAWIDIPGKGYSIAKYPITNAQFAKFIEAGGYDNSEWWTDGGWDARLKGWDWDMGKSKWAMTYKKWAQPYYWEDMRWNDEEKPVVGVSWFECVAFCLWLSDISKEKIMLPSEEQWLYAAQGDDERVYPWGNDWDCTRCNNSVSPCYSYGTTPVTQYDGKGDSSFGVVDMVGNIGEWCLNKYDSKYNQVDSIAYNCAIRSSSWSVNDSNDCRCDSKGSGNLPFVRENYFTGFRILRSLVS